MNTDEILRKALQLGSESFKDGNYSRALRVFARGIAAFQSYEKSLTSSHRNPSFVSLYRSLLDSRAACYDKLNRSENALQDAETLISADKYGTKGYLRKCKILYRLGKEDDALKTLQNGIHHIEKAKIKYPSRFRVNEKLVDRMKRQRQILADKLRYLVVMEGEYSKLVRNRPEMDPIEVLPLEIITQILSYVKQNDVMNLMLASSHWKKVIMSSPQVFNRPSLGTHITRTRFDNFLSFYRHLKNGGNIESLTVHTLPKDEKYVVKYLLDSGLHISELNLVLSQVSTKELVQMIGSSPNSRSLFRHIKSFFLSGVFAPYGTGVNDILSYFGDGIENIYLRITDIRHERSLGISPPSVSLPSLKTLKIRFNVTDASIKSEILHGISSHAEIPNVSDLSLSSCMLTPDDLSQIINSNVKDLELQGIEDMTLKTVFSILSASGCKLNTLKFTQRSSSWSHGDNLVPPPIDLSCLSELTVLLVADSNITAAGIHLILDATNHHLKQLYLERNSWMAFGTGPVFDLAPESQFSFQNLVESCPHLQILSLAQCSNFDDSTLMSFAREINHSHGLKELKQLFMPDNRITNRGVSCLFENPDFRLAFLDITGSDIDPYSIDYLTKRGYCGRVSCVYRL